MTMTPQIDAVAIMVPTSSMATPVDTVCTSPSTLYLNSTKLVMLFYLGIANRVMVSVIGIVYSISSLTDDTS